MNVKILKVGGSVLKCLNDYFIVAESIKKRFSESKIVMVLSAINGFTDYVFAKKEINNMEGKLKFSGYFEASMKYPEIGNILNEFEEKYSFTKDFNLAYYGELISAKIMEKVLGEFSLKSEIIEPDKFIEISEEGIKIKGERYLEDFISKNHITLIPGFYGSDSLGNIRLLPRGGSDLTAAMIGGFLKDSDLIFIKDVPGIYNVDPKVFRMSEPARCISYDSLKRISDMGARILSKEASDCIGNIKVRAYLTDVNLSKGTEIGPEFSNNIFLINDAENGLNQIVFDCNEYDFRPLLIKALGIIEKNIGNIKKIEIDRDKKILSVQDNSTNVIFNTLAEEW
ncbi:amino acid kinase family protein [Caldiplasma sukawensis]